MADHTFFYQNLLMEFQFPDCEPKSAANMHTQGRQLSANL